MTTVDKKKVSYIIVTHNRKEFLKEAVLSVLVQNYSPLELIVVDNGSTDGTDGLFKTDFKNDNIKYIKLDNNIGAPEGRNIAIKEAKGDIIIGIDSDTEIYEKNATQKIVDKFAKDETIGLLTFKVLNYYTKKLQRSAFPTRNYAKNSPEKEFETTWFSAMAYALPRKVFKKVGLYKDFYPYMHEELDLSFRILDKGFKIIYYPAVTILHKINKKRPERLKGKWDYTLANRIKGSALSLPFIYVISTGILWSIRILLDSKGDFLSLCKAWKSLYKKRSFLKNERQVLSRATVKRIRSLRGPLWY